MEWERVLFVDDLLTDDGRFLEHTDFCNLYGIRTNILEYYGIVNAIKRKWPLINKRGTKTLQPFQPMVYDMLFKQTKKVANIFMNIFSRPLRNLIVALLNGVMNLK